MSALILPVVPWLIMSMAIGSVIVVANDVNPPIWMTLLPSMKAFEPDWITDQPDIARSQIVILVTHETDVFVTVPVVIIRNHRHFYHRRSHNHSGFDSHPPIRLNYTT
jgi:hypothetical protein